MDTCERCALHEDYKKIVKKMLLTYSLDMVKFFQFESETDLTVADISHFCDCWAEAHCKPAKFEDQS